MIHREEPDTSNRTIELYHLPGKIASCTGATLRVPGIFMPILRKDDTMGRKKKGQLPSGSIRRRIYDHSEPVFDSNGKPVIDPKTGNQKMKRIYLSVTASTVQEANLATAEIKAGIRQPNRNLNMTLADATEKYIASCDSVLSPSTIRGYRIIQRNSFQALMGMKLSNIDTEVLRQAVNAECKRTKGKHNPKPISPKTIKNSYGLVSTVLHVYAPHINCDVKLPQLKKNQHDLSTPDVIFNLVKGTEMELPVLLAMWLSFTASEIQGLTKSKSISPDGQFISIKEVVVKDENNVRVTKATGKQPTRNRTVRIPEYIKELIDKVETDRLVTMTGDAMTQRFIKMIKKSGLPHMTFHDLRHVNASVMALLKIPDKYAQERGGWKTDNIMKSTYMQTFSLERMAVDTQIDSYFTDLLFPKDNTQIREKKYQCWLTLFDKKDTDENKKLFNDFCKDNGINIA